MAAETYAVIAAVTTLFIFLGTGGLATAVWRYFWIWREEATSNKVLAFMLMLEHVPFLFGFLLSLLARIYLYSNHLVQLEDATPGAAWRGLAIWFIFMLGGVLSGGISLGWFTPKKEEEFYP